MARAYTPGLEVVERTTVIRTRELPLPGRALVKVGERVTSQTPVLAAELPGELDIVRIADRLGLEPEQVRDGLKVKVGTAVQPGDVLCEVKSFFGLFHSDVRAARAGTVEFFTEANGHLGIRQPSVPFQVNAYVDGEIVEVDEGKSVNVSTEGALLQGIFGVGGERWGEIFPLAVGNSEVVRPHHLERYQGKLVGKVLVGGARFDQPALGMLAGEGVQAVMTGSIDAGTLRAFVGHEIGVSITGDENVPFTLIITEGFGTLPMSSRVMQLAERLAGRKASVNGATQVRAGAIRPEIVVPDTSGVNTSAPPLPEKVLDVGSRVRLIRVPYFGMFGQISALVHEPHVIETGACVRVAMVRLDDGREVVVPRANVELV